MDPLTGLLLAVAVGGGTGAGFLLAIRGPLNRMLAQACDGRHAVLFWGRFTQVMLCVSPLFIAVAFGLPPGALLPETDAAALLVRLVSASLVGGFLAMLGMGWWVAAMSRQLAASSSRR